ncbi:MAG TPA: hypothetical protein VMW51_10390 [Terriglobia bacterium]|nr:hypothetical protein [Terriglobia bacterium]
MGGEIVAAWRERLFESSQDKLRECARRANELFADSIAAMRSIYRSFDGLPKGQTLGGFNTFNEWAVAADNEFNLKDRQVHYYRLCGQFLLGEGGLKVDEIKVLGVERSKVLAAYIRDTGHGPTPEVMDLAKDPGVSAKEFRSQVNQIVFHGADDHRGGRWDVLEVSGPSEAVKDVRRKMALGRKQLGDTLSDAEVLSEMLGPVTNELLAEEAMARSAISGLPASEITINLDGEEVCDARENNGNGCEPEEEGVSVHPEGEMPR